MVPERPPRGRSLAGAAAAAALGATLAWAVLDLPDAPSALAERVLQRAPEAGATNPVTSVLLGFRAYDTWLELAVVLAAALGVLAVARSSDVTGRTPPPPEPLLAFMTAIVVPAGVLAGGLLLWLGTSAPGGAFQAGAVLGAVALLLWLAGGRSVGALPARALRPLIGAGVAAFTALAAVPLLAGGAMLEVAPGAATAVIVAVEGAVTVAVAVTLPLMVIAVRAGAAAGPGAHRSPWRGGR